MTLQFISHPRRLWPLPARSAQRTLFWAARRPMDLFPLGQVSAFVQRVQAGGEVLRGLMRSPVAAMGSDV